MVRLTDTPAPRLRAELIICSCRGSVALPCKNLRTSEGSALCEGGRGGPAESRRLCLQLFPTASRREWPVIRSKALFTCAPHASERGEGGWWGEVATYEGEGKTSDFRVSDDDWQRQLRGASVDESNRMLWGGGRGGGSACSSTLASASLHTAAMGGSTPKAQANSCKLSQALGSILASLATPRSSSPSGSERGGSSSPSWRGGERESSSNEVAARVEVGAVATAADIRKPRGEDEAPLAV